MKLSRILNFFIVLTNINCLDQSSQSSLEFIKTDLLKHYAELAEQQYVIKRTAGIFVLAKKRKSSHSIVIQAANGERKLEESQRKIKLYSGGHEGFAWRCEKHQVNVFNLHTQKKSTISVPKCYRIFDVVLNNNQTYIYGFDSEKNETLLCYSLDDYSYQAHYFNRKSDAMILDDGYIRYSTIDNRYFLIEGLPQFSPSLLINYPQQHTIGIFKSMYSDKHIAISKNLKKYAIHTNETFMLHDYEEQKDTLYKFDQDFFKDELIIKIAFDPTEEVLLVQAETKIWIVSFEQSRHWERSFAMPIINIICRQPSEKPIIQTADNKFGYLEYNHQQDQFEMTYN